MLQTLREYALSELERAGTLAVARRRHATHYLAWPNAVAAALRGPEQGRLLSELETDHEEMRTGLGWLTAEERREEALRLCVALAPFWDVRGHWVEGTSPPRVRAPGSAVRPDAPQGKGAALAGRSPVVPGHARGVTPSPRGGDRDVPFSGRHRLLGESASTGRAKTALFQGDIPAMQRYTDALTELAERLDDRRLRALARCNRPSWRARSATSPGRSRLADAGARADAPGGRRVLLRLLPECPRRVRATRRRRSTGQGRLRGGTPRRQGSSGASASWPLVNGNLGFGVRQSGRLERRAAADEDRAAELRGPRRALRTCPACCSTQPRR